MTNVHAVSSAAPASASVSPRSQRLHDAAQQFEALLLGELLKPLGRHASMDGSGPGGADNEEESGPLQSLATESVAGALARSGALGLADRLVGALEERGSPRK